jgi:hypothetical protein
MNQRNFSMNAAACVGFIMALTCAGAGFAQQPPISSSISISKLVAESTNNFANLRGERRDDTNTLHRWRANAVYPSMDSCNIRTYIKTNHSHFFCMKDFAQDYDAALSYYNAVYKDSLNGIPADWSARKSNDDQPNEKSVSIEDADGDSRARVSLSKDGTWSVFLTFESVP